MPQEQYALYRGSSFLVTVSLVSAGNEEDNSYFPGRFPPAAFVLMGQPLGSCVSVLSSMWLVSGAGAWGRHGGGVGYALGGDLLAVPLVVFFAPRGASCPLARCLLVVTSSSP